MAGLFLLFTLIFAVVRGEKVMLLDTETEVELNWQSFTWGERGWLEETFSERGTNANLRAYVVCEVDDAAADNWIRTPWLARGPANALHVEIRFSMRDCRDFPGSVAVCKESFSLLAYESDTPDASPGWNSDNWKLVDSVTADHGKFTTTEKYIWNVETRSLPVTKKGVFFALRDQGACASVVSMKVYYTVCPRQVSNFSIVERTAAGSTPVSVVDRSATCVSNAHPTGVPGIELSDANGGASNVEVQGGPQLWCRYNGEWKSVKGECKCNAGYWGDKSKNQCVACRPGEYQRVPGSPSCLSCPANSEALLPASHVCACKAGFYRTDRDGVDAPCTREPSAPRNPSVVRTNQTVAEVTWSPPADLGGRLEHWYSFSCDGCPENVRFSPDSAKKSDKTRVRVSGLEAGSTYTLLIRAENDITSKLGVGAKYVVLDVTTESYSPMRPRNVRVVARSLTSVSLAWDPPMVGAKYRAVEVESDRKPVAERMVSVRHTTVALNNAPEISYQARYYRLGTPVRTGNKTVTKPSVTFDDLTPNVMHYFHVRSYLNGWGEWSDAIQVTPSDEDVFVESTNGHPNPQQPTSNGLPADLSRIGPWLAVTMAVSFGCCCVLLLGACWWRRAVCRAATGRGGSDCDRLDYKEQSITPDYNHFPNGGTYGRRLPNRGVPGYGLNYPPTSTPNTLSRGGVPKIKSYVDPLTYEDPARLLHNVATEINPACVIIEEVIGHGEFGEVCRGRLKQAPGLPDGFEVAIKTLKDTKVHEKNGFLSEATRMAQFDHKNVIRLVGVVSRSEPAMIITEYMCNRALNQFLQSNFGELAVEQLVRMLRDVADGMYYLSSAGYVHRDLAARNVLVDADLTCKMADFGLSRDITVDAVYDSRGGMIPVRWTAPEAIKHRRYTRHSDVWSFGVVAWEVMSFGDRPYADWPNQTVLDKLDKGYRLPQPQDCPPAIYQLMLDCWQWDPRQRPTFAAIAQHVDNLCRYPDLLWAVDTSCLNNSRGTDSTTVGASLERRQWGDAAGEATYHHLQSTPILAPGDATFGAGANAVREFLHAVGIRPTCVDQLCDGAGVRSLDQLARLQYVDYRRHGVDPADEQTIRAALARVGTVPNGRMASLRHAGDSGATLSRRPPPSQAPPPPPPPPPPPYSAASLVCSAKHNNATYCTTKRDCAESPGFFV